jgi:hypothetical protein
MNQNEPNQGAFSDLRSGARVMTGLLHSVAVTGNVFLHRNLGPRYMGLQAAAAVLLIPLWTVFWPHDDCRPLLWFLLAYLAMCFFARIGICWRFLRGRHAHSRYDGTPRLLRLLPWMGELRIKQFVEPALVFTIGVLLLPVSQPLGSYLMLVAFALFASVSTVQVYQRQRVMNLHDAFLDQREVVDGFRRMRDD